MLANIIDYGMNGEGVAKIDNKVFLINNCLIGEQVEIEVVKDYGNYSIGKVTKIITESPNRTNITCNHCNNCGGCCLQHMKYDEQLKFKSILVEKTLKKVANITFSVNNCIASDKQFNYRNKISFNFNNNQSGFYMPNSHDIVEILSCNLASENINKVYSLFVNYLKTNKLSGVKNLVVRDIDNQILVGVVAKAEIALLSFYNQLEQNFANVGLYLIINTRKDSVVLSGKVKHIAGIKNIQINNFGLAYNVDLIGFQQININIQNQLYNKVLSYIHENETVINAFSGQGLLSAIIATKAKKVIGIEIVKNSHLSAEQLKKQNNITNLTNICADFNTEISKHLHKTDTIVLDPSKKGIGKQTIAKINGIKNIIYISCNPIALAKDLRELSDYEIEEIQPFDMFPNTNSVETLVKLKLKNKE